MNFNNSIIKDIITSEFFDDLFFSINDYMSNLTTDDFDDIFENYIDFIRVNSINLKEIITYEVNYIYEEIEIIGKMEVEILVKGNVDYEEGVFCIESQNIVIEVDYIFYFDTEEQKYKDFEIIEIFI